jgi:hypothetical protein
MNRTVYVALSDDKQKHPFSRQRDVVGRMLFFRTARITPQTALNKCPLIFSTRRTIPCASAIQGFWWVGTNGLG